MERAAGPISSRMLELAALRPGDRVLDLATGSGDPALAAARMVGPDGEVVGVDTVEPLLGYARDRAREAELENLTFLKMDVASLDFPPASFNAALCKFGLMFFNDYQSVVGSVHRLLAEGGRFVASVWGVAAEVPAISITVDVLRDELGIHPTDSSPHPFALSDPTVVLQKLSDAGFTELHVEPVPVIFEFRSPEQYMHYMHDVAHQVNLLFQELTPVERTTVWDAIVDRAARYVTAEGVVRFENSSFVVAGRKR
jgi:SAM-dependent methyltransferase